MSEYAASLHATIAERFEWEHGVSAFAGFRVRLATNHEAQREWTGADIFVKGGPAILREVEEWCASVLDYETSMGRGESS